MENLLPDYSLWRKKYKRTTVISYLIVLVMEFAIFFVTLLLFCIPIAMTIVFGDKLLLYVT